MLTEELQAASRAALRAVISPSQRKVGVKTYLTLKSASHRLRPLPALTRVSTYLLWLSIEASPVGFLCRALILKPKCHKAGIGCNSLQHIKLFKEALHHHNDRHTQCDFGVFTSSRSQ